MVIRIVRFSSGSAIAEGLRIGTVRRPARGVPKASRHSYDLWFPVLAPGVEAMKLGQQAASPAQWVLRALLTNTGASVAPATP